MATGAAERFGAPASLVYALRALATSVGTVAPSYV